MYQVPASQGYMGRICLRRKELSFCKPIKGIFEMNSVPLSIRE